MNYDFLTYAVLILAAYRITRFFVHDSLMGFGSDSDSRISVRLDRFAYAEDGSGRSWWREYLGDLLTCTWCLGFWISLAVYAAFAAATSTYEDVPFAIHVINVFAIAGGQGYLNSRINA